MPTYIPTLYVCVLCQLLFYFVYSYCSSVSKDIIFYYIPIHFKAN